MRDLSISRILWEKWDPIGVYHEDNEWDDEYNGYVPSLFKLAIENRDESRIANHLKELAQVSIGLQRESVTEKDLCIAIKHLFLNRKH